MTEVTITGVLYDKVNRTSQNVVLIGDAYITGLTIGGGPIIPPGQPPLGIWGPTDPRPTPPIPIYPGGTPNPPVIWPGPGVPPEGQAPIPSHPIALPGDPWWPPTAPPTMPPPGSPPVIIPGGTPVHPITPPPAIVVDYPGIGKVLVPQPVPPA